MKQWMLALGLLFMLSGSAQSLWAEDAKPETVALDQLPAEVKTGAEKALPGFTATEAGKSTVEGTAVYMLMGTADGKKYSLTVSADGTVKESKAVEEPKKE